MRDLHPVVCSWVRRQSGQMISVMRLRCCLTAAVLHEQSVCATWSLEEETADTSLSLPGPQSGNMSTFVTLSSGQRMPMIGLGTWKSAPGQVKQAVLTAVDCGYRHIDCAAAYGNEQEVGEALALRVGQGKALPREDVFVTSKLWNTKHDPEDVEEACRTSLAHLGLSYLDLYLMHWPMAFQRGKELMPRRDDGSICYSDTHYRETWMAMESLVDKGLVKAIGLSNFNARQTDDIISIARHKPVVNQVECHPYLSQTDLLSHCRSVAVCVTAYSPLGSGDRPWASPDEPSLLEDPRLGAIAQRYQKSPAQVILRWHIQRGVVCIPKSVTPSRIQQNSKVFDFVLSQEDMKLIESCNRSTRFIVPTVEKDGERVWRDAEHPHFPFCDPY